ncbi:MAG: hypothetical protein WD065_13985 [Planctomycetaceae bacterium]
MRIAETLFLLGAICSLGATRQTDNFTIHAANQTLADGAAALAEQYRHDLADQWFEGKLPSWSTRCIVTIDHEAEHPAGRTTFSMDDGRRIANLRIVVKGSLDDVLYAVLPHEITHVVFATHFGNSLPRWADEGAAILAEGEPQQWRQRMMAADLLSSRRELSLPVLMGMREYPKNDDGMTAVYVQGFSLVEFLVHDKGKPQFIVFLREANRQGWDRAVKKSYGDASIGELETRWKTWVGEKRQEQKAKPGKRRWA